MKFVTYLRVSTDRQGRSGLGLDAQRLAVMEYVKSKGEIVAEFIEVESGKKADRPQLALALSESKRCGATLLIAKLDRLSRNVSFIADLLNTKVDIIAADMPEANRFVWHILAAVAEQEASAISERTRAALAAAKVRGVALGWSIPKRKEEQREASRKGAEMNAFLADQYASTILPLISHFSANGMSLRDIAEEMNKQGVKTARGGKWHASTVRNIISRKTPQTACLRQM